MKISVIGKSNQLYWLENIVSAFLDAGCQVQPLAYNKLGFYADSTRTLLKAFNKQKSVLFNTRFIGKNLDEFEPDLILVISPLLLPVDLSDLVSNYTKAVKVAWVGDLFSQSATTYFNFYDHVFFTDTGFLSLLNADNNSKYSYLPLAVNEKLFFDKGLSRSNSMVFIGSSTDNRNHFIENLNPETDITLMGNRWKSRLSQKARNNVVIKSRKLSITDVAGVYNKSNFVLNMRHAENVINGLNMRTFEAMSTGCCVLQDAVADATFLFEDKKELLVYEDEEHLYQLWKWLVSDPASLQDIQSRAKQHVLAKHTYSHRAKQMINMLLN